MSNTIYSVEQVDGRKHDIVRVDLVLTAWHQVVSLLPGVSFNNSICANLRTNFRRPGGKCREVEWLTAGQAATMLR